MPPPILALRAARWLLHNLLLSGSTFHHHQTLASLSGVTLAPNLLVPIAAARQTCLLPFFAARLRLRLTSRTRHGSIARPHHRSGIIHPGHIQAAAVHPVLSTRRPGSVHPTGLFLDLLRTPHRPPRPDTE